MRNKADRSWVMYRCTGCGGRQHRPAGTTTCDLRAKRVTGRVYICRGRLVPEAAGGGGAGDA
jgi:hypothetical protein